MRERTMQGSNSPARAAPGIRLATLLLLAVATLTLCAAAPRFRPPRTAAVIQKLMAEGPHAGDCAECHTAHAEARTPQPGLLLAPNDNALCADCHNAAWTDGSFPGAMLYSGSAHGSSAQMTWPGPDPPARGEAGAAGKCLNCHDPHGWTDASGRIPQLTLQREEKLCLTCHDGSPATSQVMSDLQKPFRHPAADFVGRHTGPGESQPSDFSRTPVNRRHAECADCHNPHTARADGLGGPAGIEPSLTTLGTGRVAVLNGAAGTQPLYTFLAPSDTLTQPTAEYQLCFKCHSSWTTAPSGQTDFARVLNPANPSFHPVEATGANPNISPQAFAPGWSASSLTRCGDCHGSDFGLTRGPHGSIYPAILRAPYDPNPAERTMASNELCFSCHSYDVYADPGSAESERAASRFNRPQAGKGHAEHVGEARVPCASCHVTHGSASQPFLMATGRNPGIVSYTKSANGGTCAPTCHGPETYTVNYAR